MLILTQKKNIIGIKLNNAIFKFKSILYENI
jgi:hypothetical protein